MWVKTECHSQSIEIHNRWERQRRMLNICLKQTCWSAFHLTHWNKNGASFLHPAVDMLTKPLLISDSWAPSIAPACHWFAGLYEISMSLISPQTYIHLVLQIYTSSYIQTGKSSMLWEYIRPFWGKKGVNLSLFHEETSISQWPVRLIWCRGWSNKLN